MKNIKLKLGYVNGFYIQRQGKGGGLVMFWRKEVNLEIRSFSRHHINAMVIEEVFGFKWRLMGFCGHLETHRRKESWRFLDTLNCQIHLSWLCVGDFNKILSAEENLRGASRPQQQMEAFRNIVNKCGFKDMGFSGVEFTWCNQQEGDNRVYLRLDKAITTLDWLEHFPNVKVQHLEDTTSDHCPLLLADSNTIERRGKHRFLFKAI